MKVLISGYYGFGNVGDEAVLEAILQGLRRYDPEINLTVLSASPQLTVELNNVKSVHRYNWLRIFLEMLRSDVLLSGGGTLFQDVTSSRSFWYYLLVVLLAKVLRKRVVIFAQGFGPLRGRINRAAARLVLNRVDLITLRDQDSFKELQKLGVRRPPTEVTADPAFLLDLPPPLEGRKILSLEGIPLDRPLLAVSVRSIPRRPDLEKKLFQALAEKVDRLVAERNYRPVFLLFQCPEDVAQASSVMKLMKSDSSVVFRICRPREMLALISQCAFLIGMRLHSLIFAVMSGVPMEGISYDPKVEAFLKIKNMPLREKAERNFELFFK